VLLNLGQGFLDRGFRVDLVLSAGQGLELWTLPTGMQVVDLDAPRVSMSLSKLVQYLKRERPAAIIPSLHFANEVALVAKYLAGVPTRVLIPEHNFMTLQLRHHEVGSRKYTIPLIDRLLYPFADCITAVSQGVATDVTHLTGFPLEQIQVIYNPVITPQLEELAKQAVEHPWFQPGELPVVLGVGRLADQKDFPTLLKAFDLVQQQQPCRLMILGEGPDRPQLEALVQELGLETTVSLPGFVSNPFAYMAQAAVFVLSSAWEGMSNVLVEAMAVGTPVVSTDCQSGPAEVLGHGRYGWLAPVGDAFALAEAIGRVLEGKGKAIDPQWLDQFRVETVTQRYLDALGLS
jgi:glycosyltransferase involved in cell wall biosynthesis